MPAFKYPRTSQPQGAVEIDWGNPLASTLSAAALARNGGTESFSRARPIEKVSRPNGSGIVTRIGKAGTAVTRSGSNTVHALRLHSVANATTTAWEEPTGPMTWAAVILRNGNNDIGNAPIFSNATPWASPYSAYMIVDWTGTGTLSFECSAGGVANRLETSLGFTTGVLQVVAGRYNGAKLEGFSNGKKDAASVACSGAITYPATRRGPAIGNFYDYPDASRSFNGEVYLVAVWNAALSDAEIKEFSDNPWQLFKPVSRSLWIPGTVSGGGTATVIPIGQQATGSVGTLVATGAAKGFPSGVSASSAVGTPVAVGGSSIPATVTPAGVSVTGSVGTVTATGQAKAYPSGVIATASVGSPVALAGGAAVATPAGVQAVGAVGNLIATGAAWAVPGGVSASVAVGTPVASGGAAVAAVAYPAGLVGYWSVGTPTINTTSIETVSGAATRPSRLQVSNRAPRYQTGTRHAR